MQIINDKSKIYFLQKKLLEEVEKHFTQPKIRRASIPTLNEDIQVLLNTEPRLWIHYKDNTPEKKYTFFFGNWKFGKEKLPYSGSISLGYDGSTSNAGLFTEKDGARYLLHSGRFGGKKKFQEDLFTGEKTTLEIEGSEKEYIVVAKMNEPDLIQNIVHFIRCVK